MKSTPPHSVSSGRTWPIILVLSVVQLIKIIRIVPLQPTHWVHQAIHITFHEHSPRIFLPWTAQKCIEGLDGGLEIGCGKDLGILDRNPSVLKRVVSGLGRNDIGLAVYGPSDENDAILENSSSIAEDEVYGAVDVALSVELSLGMDHESVLVALEGTLVEDREVRGRSESHCLAF